MLLNLRKSKESSRDWHFSKIVNTSNVKAQKIDLKKYIESPTLNQGEVGFCHSFASAAIKNAQERIETGIPYELSPLYIAKKAKEIDGLPNDEGTDLLTICKVLKKYGTIEEKYYPFEQYVPGSVKFPNVKDEEKLEKFKIGNYARVDTLEDLKVALNMGKYVLIGIQVTNDIYSLKDYKGKDIPMLPFDPNGRLKIIGGHAIVGVADCPEVNGILCKNSWGPTYGINGFFYIPYEYFTFKTKDIGFSMVMDMFATIDIENDPIKADIMEFYIGSSEASVKGKRYEFTQPPKIDKETNRTVIGLRDISEIFGCDVYWDDAQKKITVVKK